MIYTVTLNPAIDYDIYLNKFNLGTLNNSNKINLRAGGKGINVSIMLNNLSEENTALGFVGGFTGKYLLSLLDELNIYHKFIQTDVLTRINVKINDDVEETEIAGITESFSEKYLKELLEILSKTTENDILILSGSIPKHISETIYYEISKTTKAKIVLDTRGNLLMQNVNNNLLIKPNIKELEEVFNVKFENEKMIYEYCKIFFEKGVKNILVSMGSQGALLIKPNLMLKGNVPSGKYINSIGAGDSTVAGFTYAYVNNYSEKETLKLAIACGSATAYSYGIGNKELINDLLNKIEITEVNL